MGLPKEWQFPPGLFDVFPHLHEQIRNALLTASGDELEGARAACRLLSRIFDNPENWRRGAIVIAGAPLPWRAIKLVGLIWPAGEYPTCMITQLDEKPTATPFPRFLRFEEAARLLGVSTARISMWIGECKLPVAARSEYAGFLLRTLTVETVGRELAEVLPARHRTRRPPRSVARGRSQANPGAGDAVHGCRRDRHRPMIGINLEA